jgi:hypothetical protein
LAETGTKSAKSIDPAPTPVQTSPSQRIVIAPPAIGDRSSTRSCQCSAGVVSNPESWRLRNYLRRNIALVLITCSLYGLEKLVGRDRPFIGLRLDFIVLIR